MVARDSTVTVRSSSLFIEFRMPIKCVLSRRYERHDEAAEYIRSLVNLDSEAEARENREARGRAARGGAVGGAVAAPREAQLEALRHMTLTLTGAMEAGEEGGGERRGGRTQMEGVEEQEGERASPYRVDQVFARAGVQYERFAGVRGITEEQVIIFVSISLLFHLY
jgi:hypothetical protein